MRSFPTNVYCVKCRLTYQIFTGHLLCAWHWGYGANKTKFLFSSDGGKGQTLINNGLF